MLQAVWIATIVLGAIAALEPRSRPMLALMALVWLQSAIADAMGMHRLFQIAGRVPIDLIAGLFAVMLATRERWSLAVPVLFGVTLIAHGAFWMSRAMGVDLWLWYAHSLNLLFLAQMMAIAYPGGERLAGELASVGRVARSWWRRPSGGGFEKEGSQTRQSRDTQTHGWTGHDVFLPGQRG